MLLYSKSNPFDAVGELEKLQGKKLHNLAFTSAADDAKIASDVKAITRVRINRYCPRWLHLEAWGLTCFCNVASSAHARRQGQHQTTW